MDVAIYCFKKKENACGLILVPLYLSAVEQDVGGLVTQLADAVSGRQGDVWVIVGEPAVIAAVHVCVWVHPLTQVVPWQETDHC